MPTIYSEGYSAIWEMWDKERSEKGCLPILADSEDDDSGIPERGFAIFQNTDAESDTNNNGQGVKIRTPSTTGSNQVSGPGNFAAALNNVRTNNPHRYFMQNGILMSDADNQIVWTEDHPDLRTRKYRKVPYLANTLYQFAISRSGGSWQLCAGNDENIEQYECMISDHATGTSLLLSTDTSVFFETGNDHDTWHDGFPDTISASDAETFRNGIGHAWTHEDRVSLHDCGGNQYPVIGAMGQTTTLKNNGTGTWTLSGVPLACPAP